jgi:hypothetical protein
MIKIHSHTFGNQGASTLVSIGVVRERRQLQADLSEPVAAVNRVVTSNDSKCFLG